MKNKITLFTIIIILTLSTGAISTPTTQPPQQTTPYKVDKTWHLGTLNFTVGSLFVYNVNFSDGQLNFTVKDIPKNIAWVEIPAEITCNPRFISPFSIPICITWRVYGAVATGGGSLLILPNGREFQTPHFEIAILFPEDRNQSIADFSCYLLINILHHINIPIYQPSYIATLNRK